MLIELLLLPICQGDTAVVAKARGLGAAMPEGKKKSRRVRVHVETSPKHQVKEAQAGCFGIAHENWRHLAVAASVAEAGKSVQRLLCLLVSSSGGHCGEICADAERGPDRA